MPVFDFSSASEEKEAFVCTYTAFTSDSSEKTPDDPILVLDNQQKQWSHHSTGVFCNQSQWTAFEFKEEDETFRSNILRIDARFVNLIKWLGENRITFFVQGKTGRDGYAVYKTWKMLSRWNETLCGGWIFTVCDGTPFYRAVHRSRRMRTKS